MAHDSHFDVAFRTLLTYARRFLIALVNLMFEEKFTDNAVVEMSDTDFVVPQEDESQASRRADANFTISENGIKKRYHYECQSSPDNSILLRFVEYGGAIALEHSYMGSDGRLIVELPNSALIDLRATSASTKGSDIIEIRGSLGSCEHEVKVIRVPDYSLQDLLDRNVLFLVPFFIFRYDKALKRDDLSEEAKSAILDDCNLLIARLDGYVQNGTIDDFERHILLSTTDDVIRVFPTKHATVIKEAHDMLNAPVLDFEAARIHDAALAEGLKLGKAEGKAEGKVEGKAEGIISVLQDFDWDDAAIARELTKRLGMSVKDAITFVQAFHAEQTKA